MYGLLPYLLRQRAYGLKFQIGRLLAGGCIRPMSLRGTLYQYLLLLFPFHNLYQAGPEMGIPGLASQIHRYGSYASIPQQKATTFTQTVAGVVDGPSLAHSIYSTGKYDVCKDGIIAQCAYKAIGREAVAWLDRLRSYGFEM